MCILRILDILSACEVWFKFIFRTQEHRAVEDFVIKDLHDSRGSCLRLLPRIPHLYLDYITLLVICQAFFSSSFWCDGLESNQQVPVRGFHSGVCGFTLGVHALDYHHISFVPLLYHAFGDLSRGFLHFLRTFFSKAPTPVLHSQWQAFVYGYPLPLTMIVYHRPHQKSIGNFAQIRDFFRMKIYSIFLLTNCGPRVIMKIRRAWTVGAPLKSQYFFTFFISLLYHGKGLLSSPNFQNSRRNVAVQTTILLILKM